MMAILYSCKDRRMTPFHFHSTAHYSNRTTIKPQQAKFKTFRLSHVTQYLSLIRLATVRMLL